MVHRKNWLFDATKPFEKESMVFEIFLEPKSTQLTFLTYFVSVEENQVNKSFIVKRRQSIQFDSLRAMRDGSFAIRNATEIE